MTFMILLALSMAAAVVTTTTATAAMTTTAAAAASFSIELIHRDSPKSPFYNHSATSLDRARASIYRSALQASRIAARVQRKGGIESFDAVSRVVPDSFEYLMELRVGTPPFSILAIADTGSDLIWANCVPCTKCYKQTAPYFDPGKSSSYRTLPCQSNLCKVLSSSPCAGGSSCEYHYEYDDGSKVDGVLGTEDLTFDSSSGSPLVFSNIAFGCNSQSSGVFSSRTAGLAGLSASPVSLVSQIVPSLDKSYFSYCLVPMSDTQASSKVIFGSAGMVVGSKVTTLMTVEDSLFALRLTEIIVDGAGSVPVPTSAPGLKKGNIIIDSGTTVNYLPAGVLSSLVRQVSRVVSLPKATDPDRLLPLCFKVTGESDWQKLPFITFKFAGEASVRLSPTSMFMEEAYQVVCLAVADSGSDTPIFGNVAQQNLHVGYDLDIPAVSFASADCTKF
ncbi:aspartic proteinase CDR1-like [Zingiber officinale]|uniref:aspartic proteinase CDR1-like n=1 Tax=Zingiber officinale TaxID=94328 RepID=UPI001C4BA3E9|nr:aspartic proteinase CDR1-like [Zingiber officinale]